ncbi:hypothetical protein M9H77_12958 [Catharanthus roseus]|uniref:Uncharacterized protein n=1 Tax=Catharanthus roseus TaxID=4058 RepID=A0ACC0BJ24_CATRO|nr:hypothetical protein M9H77_12958 [Catharanthus roseus]
MHKSGSPHRSIRGLYCMWLVPRTKASSDGVNVLDSGEWIHLNRGVDHVGFGRLVESQEGLEIEVGNKEDLTLFVEPNCCITWSFEFSDTKELHEVNIFIAVVTIERALRSFALYSIYIKYCFMLPIGEYKDGGEPIRMELMMSAA